MTVTTDSVELGERLERFGREVRYTAQPFSSRQWGHPLHSLCSYQGKLKPSQVAILLEDVLDADATVLDPLGGVGTVAFEAAMAGRQSWTNDLSPLPFIVARGKIAPPTPAEADTAICQLRDELAEVDLAPRDWEAAEFGLNARVKDYYHPSTLADVLRARVVLSRDKDPSAVRAFVWACLLHILHGNRPYALSRTSHPITPFSPRGPFVAKDVIQAIRDKAQRALRVPLPSAFRAGESLFGDFRSLPDRLTGRVDAIVTSPPFLGLRFDRPNWLRLWFCGWEAATFHATKNAGFLERQQVIDRSCYMDFFQMCADVLPSGGPLIVHVGAGPKGDLGGDLKVLATDDFSLEADVVEDVTGIERHGVTDKRQTKSQHLLAFVRR